MVLGGLSFLTQPDSGIFRKKGGFPLDFFMEMRYNICCKKKFFALVLFIIAALIEGACLFAILVCLIGINN